MAGTKRVTVRVPRFRRFHEGLPLDQQGQIARNMVTVDVPADWSDERVVNEIRFGVARDPRMNIVYDGRPVEDDDERE